MLGYREIGAFGLLNGVGFPMSKVMGKTSGRGVRRETRMAVPSLSPVLLHGMTAEALYGILKSRDRRFDGRIFVGVRSTGIYCRPVCTVRAPRAINCTFYATAAAAEHKGYRPCLRCRPELAPGTVAPVDAVSRLALLAVRRIEDGGLSRRGLDELASEFGVTGRHLRRAIRRETGLSAVALAQTQRLLAAKRLLTDTNMTVTEAAFAAGFESLRRFNAAFRSRYRLTPTALRQGKERVSPDDAYGSTLSTRPPFDFQSMLRFWEARAIPGVELVQGGWYRRTASIGGRAGWVAIGPGSKPYTIQVFTSASLGPVLPGVLARVQAMLDTRADPAAIADKLSSDPLLAPLIASWPGVRIPGAFDGFECGVRAILGQQVSVRAATTLAGRIAARFGQPHSTPYQGLTALFPTAEQLAGAEQKQLTELGLTTRRAETILSLAREVAEGRLRLEPGADPDRVRATLLAIPGIGDWTAEYLLLRAVGWPDAFPSGDLGLVKASGLTAAALRSRAEQWRPWRGYAAILLWWSLTRPELTNGER
jgi:AraC family transcriptional regulator of adaptative response / DNA-3-methyladenine glycosylase II